MSCAKSQQATLYPLTLGDEVNFRLVYDGPLKAQSQSDTRRPDKQKMRLAFDKQLNQLFGGDELLLYPFNQKNPKYGKTLFQLASEYKRGGFWCWPIVRESMHMVCDLDILFLRRGKPGRIVSSDGDLDNRIKVLFDALRMPTDDNEVRGLPEPESSKGLLCLLEDDKLITGFRVTSDRILNSDGDATNNHVHLIISVEIKLTKITEENLGYLRQF